jgi:Protein of unknown function (DUF402)
MARCCHTSRVHRAAFIRKQKRPDGSGFWAAYPVGEDDHGLWLFTPKGSMYRGEAGGTVGYCKVGSPEGPGIAVVHLVPRGDWWIATFWDTSVAKWSVTFDISTPPRLAERVWSYIDLELDVSLNARTGEARIDDEDEFATAVELGLISPREADEARRATEQTVRLVCDPEGRFQRAGQTRVRWNDCGLAEHMIRAPSARRPGQARAATRQTRLMNGSFVRSCGISRWSSMTTRQPVRRSSR